MSGTTKNAETNEYSCKNSTGTMKLRTYDVFPGISVVFYDTDMSRPEAPLIPSPGRIVLLHCREGRFELHAGDQSCYLSRGDFSVCLTGAGDSEVYFPTGRFQGLSIVIDPETAPRSMSDLLPGVSVGPEDIINKFCSGSKCFIMRSCQQLEHIFSELYTVPEPIRTGYFRVKVLEVMLFLSSVDISPAASEHRAGTRSQTQLAKDVCAFVSANMSAHYTITELAEHFKVSPTYLKNSFRNVFGESVYAYIRTQKMLCAAELLRDTDRTILDIAGECGYDNGSKFSQAFRSVMGAAPSEYRKSKQFPMESISLEGSSR